MKVVCAFVVAPLVIPRGATAQVNLPLATVRFTGARAGGENPAGVLSGAEMPAFGERYSSFKQPWHR